MLSVGLSLESFHSAPCRITANCVIVQIMAGNCIIACSSGYRTPDLHHFRLKYQRWAARSYIITGRTTPFSQMTDILSSTPLTPLGILVKSSLPRAFWHTEKVQLSVPVTLRSSLARLTENDKWMNDRWKQSVGHQASCSTPTWPAGPLGTQGCWGRVWVEDPWQSQQHGTTLCSSSGCHLCPALLQWAPRTPHDLETEFDVETSISHQASYNRLISKKIQIQPKHWHT